MRAVHCLVSSVQDSHAAFAPCASTHCLINRETLMRASLLFIITGLVFIAAGVGAAWGVSKSKTPGLPGNYKCENFGLPDKSFSGLRIDNDLKVYGTSGAKVVPVGQLDLRAEGLAYFDISK